MRLASLLSRDFGGCNQAGSIRDPLQKLNQQATGATRDSVQAFQNKLGLVLGTGRFRSALSDEVTLTRVNGQVAVLYGQVWQADAEPTATQSEAVTLSTRCLGSHEALGRA